MCCNDTGQDDRGASSYIAYYWYEQFDDMEYTMKFTAIQCLNLHIQANKSLKVLYSNVNFITVEFFRKKIAKHSLSSSTIVIYPTLSLNFATLKCMKNHGKSSVKCILAGYLHTLYNINVIVFGQLEQESIDTLCEYDLIYIIKKKEDAKSVYVDVKLEGVETPEFITIRLSTSI